MADEIREILKAAQAAEIRGDKPQAIAQLERAAALCRDAGRTTRAVQLLRHAARLDGARRDLALEADRLEALGKYDPGEAQPLVTPMEDDLRRALEALTGPETETQAVEPEEAPAAARRKEKRLIERGPTLADPALEAWCSFCCRPRAEVGELVAGPAGAFICAHCVRESGRLLGAEVTAPVVPVKPVEPVVAKAPAAVTVSAQAVPGAPELLGQDEAVAELEAALQRGLGWVLLLGGEGMGKSTCLRELERRGVGQYVRAAGELPASASRKVLLLDGLDGLEPARIEAVCAGAARLGAAVVLAVRGEVAEAPVVLEGNGVALPLFSTQALVTATSGRLPVEVAERIQAVVSLRALPLSDWAEVARRLAAARFPQVALSPEALDALAAEAARSPRGGHELKALIGRIPAGEWGTRAQAKPSRGSSKPRRKGGR
ncbi:MAG TPA: ClpX C4-type zinc finger protein [Longimicrobium sp.]|nr:ClpX C4-type zinc finger protein [Longimicrobium sp.]